jgi:hypothetical protein
VPTYLEPYLSAARKYGAGFGTLLWASPKTQAVRFKALLGAVDVSNLSIMDVGCGRADLLEYIFQTKHIPRSYIGLEAVAELADAAEQKQLPNCRIIRGDFLQDPTMLANVVDVVLISGALNTMDSSSFYGCLQSAFDAADKVLVFNFLCSPLLAASSHLIWHKPEEVMRFANSLSPRVEFWDNYLRGDATIAIWKEPS